MILLNMLIPKPMNAHLIMILQNNTTTYLVWSHKRGLERVGVHLTTMYLKPENNYNLENFCFSTPVVLIMNGMNQWTLPFSKKETKY